MSGGGRLVLVPTPVGNREDLSPRALRVLEEADLVAAEDTRHTGRLLSSFGLKPRYLSFHDHNETRQSERLLAALDEGLLVALVSDAGTPGISDPGFRAVRIALEGGHTVEALPGPSALIPALVASGLPCDRFCFEGYLPRKSGQRRRAFEALADEPRTTVFYESPHRIARSLGELADLMPERPVVVARELSKRYEEYWRGGAAELAAALEGRTVKGEIVLLVGGVDAKGPPPRLP